MLIPPSRGSSAGNLPAQKGKGEILLCQSAEPWMKCPWEMGQSVSKSLYGMLNLCRESSSDWYKAAHLPCNRGRSHCSTYLPALTERRIHLRIISLPLFSFKPLPKPHKPAKCSISLTAREKKVNVHFTVCRT